jgi:hypothetical protein
LILHHTVPNVITKYIAESRIEADGDLDETTRDKVSSKHVKDPQKDPVGVHKREDKRKIRSGN